MAPETPFIADDVYPALSIPQQRILDAAVDGHSIFFTGGAGTGKTLLLRHIIQQMKKKFSRSPEAVAVTSPTGSAASHIGGVTVHSFIGMGLALEDADVLADKMRYKTQTLNRWRRVKVLVIDEVSMLEAALFDKLARIACILRKSDEPFGGIQLVVTGDFFQLPPVAKASVVQFAFDAKAWRNAITHTFSLETIFRQKDQELADMLNEIRTGTVSEKTVERFTSLSRPILGLSGVEPTELYPRRADVERANDHRLNQLSTPLHTFFALDAGAATDAVRERLLANIPAQKRLTLRVGAQVMLVKNTNKELVNGSVGCITSFVKAKSEPATERPENPDENSDVPLYPLVSFRLASGRIREEVICPQHFTLESPTGEVRASRIQIPLILAWAISIHKAQGQTLDFVKVDLQKVFEAGQVYVALSRATSLDGLQVLNFHPALVRAHSRVLGWDSTQITEPVVGGEARGSSDVSPAL